MEQASNDTVFTTTANADVMTPNDTSTCLANLNTFCSSDVQCCVAQLQALLLASRPGQAKTQILEQKQVSSNSNGK